MLGWHRARVSHQLTRMGKRGLVTRERTGGVTVTLTETGRQAITTVHPTLDASCSPRRPTALDLSNHLAEA